jgi:IS1 family transposase
MEGAMANILRRDKQEAVIRCLVNGVSVRSTERIVGVHRDTILRLMVSLGDGCTKLMQEKLTGLKSEHIQVDEIWSYVGKKQKHLSPFDDQSKVGDFWIFVALDADTKLIPTFQVGKRDLPTATTFLIDLQSRLLNRVQLSSDALPAYIDAAEAAFGSEVDYGQIVKYYEAEPIGPGRYSPPEVIKVKHRTIVGTPDPAHSSTSFIERQNLTIRMSMRRLTRLTNAFSKKVENLKAAAALHFAYYNFVRVHDTLRMTPAMAAGVTPSLWTISDLVDGARAYQ